MGLKAGPYPDARAARTALVDAGYLDELPKGRRPSKWVHKNGTKPAKFAIQILDDGRAKIVPYPDLKRLDYRTTSDAERASHGFRTGLSRSPRNGSRDR
jgi:hypothetical protein